MASLPTLFSETTASAPPLSASSSPRPAATAAEECQQQEQEPQEQQQQQQQLEQLETLMKSIGLEEQLLTELKNLKRDEGALFAEDAKRMQQRFVNCKP